MKLISFFISITVREELDTIYVKIKLFGKQMRKLPSTVEAPVIRSRAF